MSISNVLKHRNTWVFFAILSLAGAVYLGVNLMSIKSQVAEMKAQAELLSEKATQLSDRTIQMEKALRLERSKVKQLEAVEARSKDDIKDYILAYYKTVPPTVAEEIAQKTLKTSEEHNVPFVTLVALIEAESHFNPFAISPLKKDPARGLTQVRYMKWGEVLGLSDKYQLHDIATGIDAGARILRSLLDDTGGNMKKALWRYVGVSKNKSVGNAYISKVYANMGKFTVFRSFAGQKAEEEEIAEAVVSDKDKTPRPPKVAGYKMHTIEKDDTLYDIAQKYWGDGNKWKKLLTVNPGVDELKLAIGSKLIIPDQT